MADREMRAGLKVDPAVAAFIEAEALPGTGIAAGQFWQGLAGLLADFSAENRALLARRDALQSRIDAWHGARRGQDHDATAYEAFLTEIGYLVPAPPAFTLETAGIDPEIATIAGPQLVVPVMNARYALNAANARWGNLYDALYGTDATGAPPPPGPYDRGHGARVIAWARDFLDAAVPLAGGSWHGLASVAVSAGALRLTSAHGPLALADPAQFAGWAGGGTGALRLLFRNHGLLLELVVDPADPVGAGDPAHIAAVRLESALTAIMDCEDSVAAVDGPDKALAWRNWLGLMRGDLAETLSKNGRTITRRLNEDSSFHRPDGGSLTVRARALMLVRNVGHLMTSPAVLDADGAEVPEGLLDAAVTTLCALHDLRRPGGPRNSPAGSVYVVKPKMHGPAEVDFACRVFDRVEEMLGLNRFTVKLGIMDEERRTSLNLAACLHAARHRLAFINTGFLDRTGDEIHTAMEAGPVIRKGAMKSAAWIAAYERNNVAAGLAAGLAGRAQIGKGMWAAPDRMEAMLAEKAAQLEAGASCAWVPSPTAATLHATHYHRVDVAARQRALAAEAPQDFRAGLLTLPLSGRANWSPDEIRQEVENNIQGILGYVVRWVDQGIGCSKVPDIHDVALMEDRATCRISSQHLANWLHHGVVTAEEVAQALRRMAAVVDRQNRDDPAYVPMAPACDGPAFRAASDLIFQGRSQPSGYTEPILHAARRGVKSLSNS